MKVHILSYTVGFIIFLAACQTSVKNDSPAPDPDNGGLTLPSGFAALKVIDESGPGRHLVVNSQGDIYMALDNMKMGGGAVAMRDTTGDGRMDILSYFGKVSGTGIKIRDNYLYFGSDTAVIRYPMEAGKLVPDENYEIIARGFVNKRQHAAKPFDFDPDGNMYVTAGAPANACMEQMRTKGSPGMDPCPILDYAGGIWRFKADVPNQDQLTDGYRYSTGIRHAVALCWNDHVNRLYAVMHGRDQLHQFFPELYDEQMGADLPAEEFLLLSDGADFGWPYCYYDPFKQALVLAPEYGGDGTKIGRCESKTDPIMAFPAHTAPDDLLFYSGDMFPEKYKHGAFIAFHGSWNRAPLPQEGYYVVFVPFDGELPSGDWEVFADGFSGLSEVKNPGDAEHRPVGLAQGPDGSLYVSDSRKGTIWRILYTGQETVAAAHEPLPEQEPQVDMSNHPGKKVYDMTCMPCHQADGNGVPGMHPPLAGSKFVNGDETPLIEIVLQGMTGEIEVNGEIYNNVMAPLSYLSDEDIANVLSFVRKSYGNDAPAITPEQVKKVRDNLSTQ